MRGSPWLLAAAISWLAGGCAHGVVVHVHAEKLEAPVHARLVMVAPVELRWSEPSSLLAYLRSLDVEEQLCRSGRLATLGPGELGPLPGAQETPSESDISRVALKTGVPVGEILFLRAWVERREQRSSVNLNDAKGKDAGAARDAQATLVAHVELSLPAMHLTLAEVSAEQALDPGAERPLLDAQPELGPLLQRAVAEALEAVGKTLVLPPPVELGLRVLPAPAPALTFALPKGKSFATSIGAQDALEQEVSRDGALDLLSHAGPPLLAPGGGEVAAEPLSPAERKAMRAERKGLWVVEARGRARAAGLEAGDQILNLDSLPATHPCAPLRAALVSERSIKLEVERQGQKRTLSL